MKAFRTHHSIIVKKGFDEKNKSSKPFVVRVFIHCPENLCNRVEYKIIVVLRIKM